MGAVLVIAPRFLALDRTDELDRLIVLVKGCLVNVSGTGDDLSLRVSHRIFFKVSPNLVNDIGLSLFKARTQTLTHVLSQCGVQFTVHWPLLITSRGDLPATVQELGGRALTSQWLSIDRL